MSVNQRKPLDSKPRTESSNLSTPAILEKYRRVLDSIHRLWQHLLRSRETRGVHDCCEVGVGSEEATDMNGVCCE